MTAWFRQSPSPTAPDKPRRPDYRQYRDPAESLTGRELTYALWYVKHRNLLYRILLGALLAVSVISWGYSLIKFGSWLARYPRDEALRQELSRFPNYLPFHAVAAPIPLEILRPVLLPGGRATFDAVVEAANPNDRWLATVRYHFVVGATETAPQEEVLLPGGRQLLVQYGLSAVPAGGFNVVIDSINWQRITPRQIAEPRAWQAERLRFAARAVVIRRGGEGPDSPLGTAVQFNLVNESAFSYRAPQFTVGLYAGNTLAAVLPLEVPELFSLGIQPIDVRSFAPQLAADAVELFPRVNVYNPAVYLPPVT